MTRIFNHLRVAGFGRQVLDFGDQQIIVSSEPVTRSPTATGWS
ncbi:MAG: hypothetical protein U1E60_09145 [Reyranellaceae bacterium]